MDHALAQSHDSSLMRWLCSLLLDTWVLYPSAYDFVCFYEWLNFQGTLITFRLFLVEQLGKMGFLHGAGYHEKGPGSAKH